MGLDVRLFCYVGNVQIKALVNVKTLRLVVSKSLCLLPFPQFLERFIMFTRRDLLKTVAILPFTGILEASSPSEIILSNGIDKIFKSFHVGDIDKIELPLDLICDRNEQKIISYQSPYVCIECKEDSFIIPITCDDFTEVNHVAWQCVLASAYENGVFSSKNMSEMIEYFESNECTDIFISISSKHLPIIPTKMKTNGVCFHSYLPFLYSFGIDISSEFVIGVRKNDNFVIPYNDKAYGVAILDDRSCFIAKIQI